MRILVLGGASYDDIIQVDEFFKPRSATIFSKSAYSMAGSTGVGKAMALQKLGFEVSFQAVIGSDIYGSFIVEELQSANVRFHPFFVNQTERHTNIMDRHGKRISIFQVIADGNEVDVKEYESLIKEADLICLNIMDYCRRFIPLIKKHRKPIYCDLHDYNLGNPYHQDFIEAADYLFLSSDRMEHYREFMRSMIGIGKKWVVVTHAERGAAAMNRDGEYVEIEADKVPLADTNGAGDNFFSGFLYGFLHGYSLRQCLLLGKFSANLCIQSKKIIDEKLSSETIIKKLSETDKN